MDFREIGCGLNWIHLAHERGLWRAFLKKGEPSVP
jgi:hypothetical protein